MVEVFLAAAASAAFLAAAASAAFLAASAEAYLTGVTVFLTRGVTVFLTGGATVFLTTLEETVSTDLIIGSEDAAVIPSIVFVLTFVDAVTAGAPLLPL